MGRKVLEKEIEKRVCDYAKEKGMLVYKFSSPNHAAVPDRLFIYHGVFFFIEFKAEGKSVTIPQAREHVRLWSNGARVCVVDNVDSGKQFIDSVVSDHDSIRLIDPQPVT